jgi:hypothetical protein
MFETSQPLPEPSALPNDRSKSTSIKILDKLSSSKFKVYLASEPTTSTFYAMKVFHANGDEINPAYLNESRFAFVKHKHIISIEKCIDRHRAV